MHQHLLGYVMYETSLTLVLREHLSPELPGWAELPFPSSLKLHLGWQLEHRAQLRGTARNKGAPAPRATTISPMFQGRWAAHYDLPTFSSLLALTSHSMMW